MALHERGTRCAPNGAKKWDNFLPSCPFVFIFWECTAPGKISRKNTFAALSFQKCGGGAVRHGGHFCQQTKVVDLRTTCLAQHFTCLAPNFGVILRLAGRGPQAISTTLYLCLIAQGCAYMVDTFLGGKIPVQHKIAILNSIIRILITKRCPKNVQVWLPCSK